MRTFLRAALAIIAVAALHAAPAWAQATRTWVSGVGDDANPCSRTAPCKTFAGSISKTATGGEINCLDSGGFGAVTITKSITIKCEGVIGGVVVSGTNAIIVNDATGNAIVTLSGLDLEGLGTGLNGIRFLDGAALHVHKTQIRNFRASGGGGTGISFEPNGPAELHVADCHITDNGGTATTGGIVIKPTASSSVNVSINRTQLENNSTGIRADSSATAGTVRGVVRDSVVAGSQTNGVVVVAPTTVATLMLDKVSVLGNLNGLVVNGAFAAQYVTNSSITANDKGLYVNGSGSIFTYRNNAVDGNITSNGLFTSVIVPE